MKWPLLICTLLLTVSFFGHAQSTPPLLFGSDVPLRLKATGSIKSIKKNTNDSTFASNVLHYESSPGQWDSIPVKARARGHFRKVTCYFPPVGIKLQKKDSRHTLFAGNKSLKIVLPCLNTDDKNSYILREYLCYLFYKQVTPYYFQTRLANIALTETSRKKPRTYDLLGFFIEDDNNMAARNGASVVKNSKIHPAAYVALPTVRHDFFQYMIGNIDWSTTFEHNSSSISLKPDEFVPVAYDFDMSGFVDAPYAPEPSEDIGTKPARTYRGFCRDQKVMKDVRAEFIILEPSFYSTIDQYASSFNSRDLKEMKDYLGEFFTIIKDDNQFKAKILEGCRTK